jgi:hypothetical protein
MRIWYLYERFRVLGGAEKLCGLIITKLRERGHSVTLITTEVIPNKTFQAINDVEKIIIPRKFAHGMVLDELRIIQTLRKYPAPDVMILNSYFALGVLCRHYFHCKVVMLVNRPEWEWKAGRIARLAYRSVWDWMEKHAYQRAKFLAMPSVYEGFSLASVEASFSA